MAERYRGTQEIYGVTSPKGPSGPPAMGQTRCGTCLLSLCTPWSTSHALPSTRFLEGRTESKTHDMGEQGTFTLLCPC